MASLISPLGVRRGRPSKTAPVYDTQGTELITSDERERINGIVAEINAAGEKAMGLLVSSAQRYFELGEILLEAEKRSTETMSAAKYAALTGIPERMVSTARKVYKKFGNEPERIEGLSMHDVLALISDRQEQKKLAPGVMHIPQPEQPSFDEDFALPPLSGVTLNNYRLHTDRQSGTIYVLVRDVGSAYPVVRLTATQPRTQGMEAAYRAMTDSVQEAIERYYATVEMEEVHHEPA